MAASLLVGSVLVSSGLSAARAARSTQLRTGAASSAAVKRLARTLRLSPRAYEERYAGFPRPLPETSRQRRFYAAPGRDTAAHAARCTAVHGVGATP